MAQAAITEKKMVISLTNHTYFSMTGDLPGSLLQEWSTQPEGQDCTRIME